jgi:hypothetical protein
VNPNTGTFAVRNSDWSRAFLAHWWSSTFGLEQRALHEQGALGLLLRRMDLSSKIRVVDAEVINSAFGSLPTVTGRRREPTTFVLHMMSQSSSDREAVFRELHDELLRDTARENM